jgi:hypothetical protein
MCSVSQTFDQWQPYIPYPVTTNPILPNSNPLVFTTTFPTSHPITLTPEQLVELLSAFHKAVESARILDQLTNQPDCEDPVKAELLKRVAELEKQLEDTKNAT